MGLEPHLREQLVSWLHWAWGSSQGPEKTLPDPPSRTEPPAAPHGPAQDGEPDPHYILGLQAEDVAAHLTAQDAVSAGGSGWEGLPANPPPPNSSCGTSPCWPAHLA